MDLAARLKNENGLKSRPFFSIGVMTYNRRNMLRECLSSIFGQTFTDFEVIVGNDYVQEALSMDRLGFDDSRARIINHSQNLGEFKNMNLLLQMSRGQYFTWLADDDMYLPTFLESVYASLTRFDFPPLVFTSYISGATIPDYVEISKTTGSLMSGRQFLQHYLNRDVLAQGYAGVCEIDYIRKIGGIKHLGTGFGPYSDNFLVIEGGLLEKVVYIDAPLLFFRTHDQSISWTSTDIDSYISAQEDFLSRSLIVFTNEALHEDFASNLYFLLKWCVGDMAAVIGRSGFVISGRQSIAHLNLLKKHLVYLRKTIYYQDIIKFIYETLSPLAWPICREAFLRKVPNWIKIPIKYIRNLIARQVNDI